MTSTEGFDVPEAPYRTLFQEGQPWFGGFNVQADMAIAYRVSDTLRERLAGWKAHGYRAGLMTGLAWGHYESYLSGKWDGHDHQDEAQCMAEAKPRLHGPGIPYMVPNDSYIRYLSELLGQAIEAGAEAIFLEEPEFWAGARYGPAFERAWLARYGAPLLDPAADARIWTMGGELQYALYTDLIDRLCVAVQVHGHGRVPCYVATHSLLNYAQNRIVSPHSAMLRMPACGGVILQVWSHTARYPMRYEGERGVQPFAVALLEYGSGLDLVRGSARRLWYLVDPVEDNATRGWDFYREGYEATVAAALLWPEVGSYEVMPWPSRVFTRRFPRPPGGPEGDFIPAHYAAEVLAICNAMSDMPTGPIEWDCGTQGVGVLVADSLMFRRAGPDQDDPELSAFYGLALPLVRSGMPVRPTTMEALAEFGVPNGIWALLLSYDGMTPPDSAVHGALAAWVMAGHALLCFGRGDDAYATVPSWWNQHAGGYGPWTDLFECLEMPADPAPGLHRVGAGIVLIEPEGPIALARRSGGSKVVREALRAACEALGSAAPPYLERPYLLLRRGHYVIAGAPGNGTEPVLHLSGRFVDLFDGDLPVRVGYDLLPGSQALLIDLDRLGSRSPGVAAASARIRDQRIAPGRLSFSASGPADTPFTARLALPAVPRFARANGLVIPIDWDVDSGTALLRHSNAPDGVSFEVVWA